MHNSLIAGDLITVYKNSELYGVGFVYSVDHETIIPLRSCYVGLSVISGGVSNMSVDELANSSEYSIKLMKKP